LSKPEWLSIALGNEVYGILPGKEDVMGKGVRHLVRSEDGTTSVEWLVICGLVVLILAAALASVVDTIRDRIGDFNDEL